MCIKREPKTIKYMNTYTHIYGDYKMSEYAYVCVSFLRPRAYTQSPQMNCVTHIPFA